VRPVTNRFRAVGVIEKTPDPLEIAQALEILRSLA
jgi:hypothetical protein